MTKTNPRKDPRGGFTYIAGTVLVASLFLAIAGLFGISINTEDSTRLILEPSNNNVVKGETFTTNLMLESNSPINAVQAEIKIDPNLLEFVSVSYENSPMDLWINEPIYQVDKNAVIFVGGITRPNGFTGQEKLMSMTFKAKENGSGWIEIMNSSVLKHDGTGADAEAKIVNAEYKINDLVENNSQPATPTENPKPKYGADLNGDGKFNLTDVSLFFSNLFK